VEGVLSIKAWMLLIAGVRVLLAAVVRLSIHGLRQKEGGLVEGILGPLIEEAGRRQNIRQSTLV
jgi:exopolyphosphatase/pppGpp-phosphohydrolase